MLHLAGEWVGGREWRGGVVTYFRWVYRWMNDMDLQVFAFQEKLQGVLVGGHWRAGEFGDGTDCSRA